MNTAMEELNAKCLSCEACPLGKTRTKLVFGDGNSDTNVMLIGEGPGEQEDLQAFPLSAVQGSCLTIC